MDVQGLAQHVEFLYTDISAQLVGYGRKTCGPKYPFARFKVVPHLPLHPTVRYTQLLCDDVVGCCLSIEREQGHLLIVAKKKIQLQRLTLKSRPSISGHNNECSSSLKCGVAV